MEVLSVAHGLFECKCHQSKTKLNKLHYHTSQKTFKSKYNVYLYMNGLIMRVFVCKNNEGLLFTYNRLYKNEGEGFCPGEVFFRRGFVQERFVQEGFCQ